MSRYEPELWSAINTFPRNDLEEIIVVMVGSSTIDGYPDEDGSPNPIDYSYPEPISTSGFVHENDISSCGFVIEVMGLLFDAENGFLVDDLDAVGLDELQGTEALRITLWQPFPDPPHTAKGTGQ